jgi:hypothetical protein
MDIDWDDESSKLAFVNTVAHRIERMWPEKKLIAHAWSTDSERFAYMSNRDELKIVYMNPTPSIKRSVQLLRQLQRNTKPVLSWSPTGDRVGILWQSGPHTELEVITVNISTGAVHVATYKNAWGIQKALAMPADMPVPVDDFLVWPPAWSQAAK